MVGLGRQGQQQPGCSWTDVGRSPAWHPKLGCLAKLLVQELETVWSLSVAGSPSVLGGELLVTFEA